MAEKKNKLYREFLSTLTPADYKLTLQRNEKRVEIIRETLSCGVNKGDSRSNKTIFMDYQRRDRENVFAPKKRLDEVVEANAENKTDLIVARKMAEKGNCSYIFEESSREIFCRRYCSHACANRGRAKRKEREGNEG